MQPVLRLAWILGVLIVIVGSLLPATSTQRTRVGRPLVGLGILLELGQLLSPGRDFKIGDTQANGAGVCVGTGIGWAVSGRPLNARSSMRRRKPGLCAPTIYGDVDTNTYILEAIGCGAAFFDCNRYDELV